MKKKSGAGAGAEKKFAGSPALVKIVKIDKIVFFIKKYFPLN